MKTYKRYAPLIEDINRLTYRSRLPQSVKNQIILKISGWKDIKLGIISNEMTYPWFIVHNARYEKEYFDWSSETEVLVFEACAKENLRNLVKQIRGER
jgi:hypothetical protein